MRRVGRKRPPRFAITREQPTDRGMMADRGMMPDRGLMPPDRGMTGGREAQ